MTKCTLLCTIELVISTGFRKDTAGERTNSVLETYAFVSQHPNAKTPQGGTNYYPDVIFKQSSFVYWLDHSSVLGAGGGKKELVLLVHLVTVQEQLVKFLFTKWWYRRLCCNSW